MRSYKILFLLLPLLILPVNAYSSDKDSLRNERLFGGEPVRTAVKLNAAVVLGIVNPSVEFRAHENITVALEGLGVFYPKGVKGVFDGPAVAAMTFIEGRYYPKQAFRGFFAAPNIGFAVWDLSKGLHPSYWGTYSDMYQIGVNFMAGITIGYSFTLTKHWGIEISAGGGCQIGFYEGHYKPDGSLYVDWNGSTEWIPYKAAVNIVYKW
ncbi:MAG TPA: DUF3575 domain-containing protein [Candidatus Coprenecus pullistercoris]|nr:DUF3575 domain-containing protein [Candidatus Coprenecus pullistercoris]